MIIRFHGRPALARMRQPGRSARLSRQTTGGLVMKWETPQAIDLRFGMEITMYIAHR